MCWTSPTPHHICCLAARPVMWCNKQQKAQLLQSSSMHFLHVQKAPPAHHEPLTSVCHIVSGLSTHHQLLPVVFPIDGPCEMVQQGTDVEKYCSCSRPGYFPLWESTCIVLLNLKNEHGCNCPSKNPSSEISVTENIWLKGVYSDLLSSRAWLRKLWPILSQKIKFLDQVLLVSRMHFQVWISSWQPVSEKPADPKRELGYCCW